MRQSVPAPPHPIILHLVIMQRDKPSLLCLLLDHVHDHLSLSSHPTLLEPLLLHQGVEARGTPTATLGHWQSQSTELQVLQVQTRRTMPSPANMALLVELQAILVQKTSLFVFRVLHDMPTTHLELTKRHFQLLELKAKLLAVTIQNGRLGTLC